MFSERKNYKNILLSIITWSEIMCVISAFTVILIVSTLLRKNVCFIQYNSLTQLPLQIVNFSILEGFFMEV